MRRLLAVSLLLCNFFGAIGPMPAYAAAPSPKFLFIGSANTCIGGSTATMSDYVIDPLSGWQYVLTDSGNGVCQSTDGGVTWSLFNTGGPLYCPPITSIVKLKKFNFMQDGTLVAFTGTVTCGSTNSAWWLDNVANPSGPNTWTHSTTTLTSSIQAIFAHGANLGNSSGYVAMMPNAGGAGSSIGAYITLDNGRTWALPTTAPTTSTDNFGALKDPNSNTVYAFIGGSPCLAYTTDPNGATWTTSTSTLPVCVDEWTPIVVPPGYGSYSGQGLTYFGTGNGSPEGMYVFGPLGSPNSLAFTDVTSNLYTPYRSLAYDNAITGIDWNYRIFVGAMSQNIPSTPGLPPSWTDTLATWTHVDTVTGNQLPDFTIAPCTSTGARPNNCIATSFAVQKKAGDANYGRMYLMMRNGDVYATELPQSHLASSFNFTAGTLSGNAGTDLGTETMAVSYLDQDTSDPTCPAITGNGTLYPSRSAGSWTSSNPAVATINASTGLVHGVSAGTAFPLFTCGGVTSSNGPAITVSGGSVAGFFPAHK
jgi:hypothetical protein